MSTEDVQLSQLEFYALMLLYAANIDGTEDNEEIIAIKQCVGEPAFIKAHAIFNEWSDYELINYFRNNKAHYFKSDIDEKNFISEVKTIIAADHHIEVIETALIHAFQKILKE